MTTPNKTVRAFAPPAKAEVADYAAGLGMDDPQIIETVVARIRELQPFKEIFVTQASCTISCHCGPNTLGVLFLTKPGSVAN